MKPSPNNPAFPTSDTTGLTLREYLAAHALQGLLAERGGGNEADYDELPRYAVRIADALLVELAKTQS